MEGLGGAAARGLKLLLLNDLANAQEITVWIDDGELSQAPRLIFKKLHARDALPWQLTRRTLSVDLLNIENPYVAACS